MTPECLLVDGYNVINAWPELRELSNRNITICIISQNVL